MYPFPAFLGQDRARTALILNLVCPRIGGVLLKGSRGTGKSTLARSLARLLPDTRLFNVPIGIDEERLLGGLDWTAAAREGRRCFRPGLLAEAHGHIVLLDDVNLMDEKIVHAVLDAAERGRVGIERDGFSLEYPCAFILAASMNPEGGGLSPHVLDRFGLCAEMEDQGGFAGRAEILERCLANENGAFQQAWEPAETALTLRLREAGTRLSRTAFPEGLLESAAVLAAAQGCPGHRGELALCRAAKALAAWQGADFVTADHLRKTAALALGHRASEAARSEPAKEGTGRNEGPHPDSPDSDGERDRGGGDEGGDGGEGDESGESGDSGGDGAAPLRQGAMRQTPGAQIDGGTHRTGPDPQGPGKPWEAGKPDILIGFSAPELSKGAKDSGRRAPKGGRGEKNRSSRAIGRPSSKSTSKETCRDISWNGTLVRALPFRAVRPKGNTIVTIMPEDLAANRRRGKCGRILVFLVDASGSMNAGRRMAAAKGSIHSALKRAYVNRDRVALMTFRKRECALRLPLTRNPAMAERLLKEIPTGGGTPLALGLRTAFDFCRKLKGREPATPVHLLLFSDGRANVTVTGGNPVEDAMEICARMGDASIRYSVIDTETGFVRLGLAQKMAKLLKASYCRLEELGPDEA